MDTIIIVDYGSQYTQLIARRVRKCNVFSLIEKPEKITNEYIDKNQPKGIILSGSPASVNAPNAPQLHFNPLETHCPILGICYGFHLLVKRLGGRVEKIKAKEYGKTYFLRGDPNPFFDYISVYSSLVWMSHGDSVIEAPGFQNIGKTKQIEWSAAFLKKKPDIIGVQFHPEVHHTYSGQQMIENFILRICQAKPQWQTKNIISLLREIIKEKVGKKHVIHGISGGVDSTTLAFLLAQTIDKKQLECILIDHGLHRKNEVEEIAEILKNCPFPCEIKQIDFCKKLAGIHDGEEKREIIGKCFVDYFKTKLKKDAILAHGTLYPDTIESNPQIGQSDKIKTHHNRSKHFKDLPLLEPFKMLFKDEVRKIAKLLGSPNKIINRQPFPGPGLAIRILGEVTSEKLRILREADAIFREEIENSCFDPAQYFAVLHSDESIGVRGDARHKGPIISLTAIDTEDFMTAEAFDLPIDFIKQVSRRITNEIEEINRVVYSVSDKPPATIEYM